MRVPNEEEQVPVTDEGRPTYFLAVTAFITDTTCQEDFIWNKMHAALGKTMSVKIRGEGVMRFKVRLDKWSIDEVQFVTTDIFRQPATFCSTFSYVKFEEVKMCPAITLTDKDYSDIMRKIRDTSRIKAINSLFDPEETNTLRSAAVKGNISVCFDDYMSALSNSVWAFGSTMSAFAFIFPALLCMALMVLM